MNRREIFRRARLVAILLTSLLLPLSTHIAHCANASTMKKRLSPKDLERARETITKLLVDRTIYDVDVDLEETSNGYNIVVTNRAEPESLSSLIDPTMIALIVGAWYTKLTSWRSDTLKIWVRSGEGWGILTEDCRVAEAQAATDFWFVRTVDPYVLRKQVVNKFFRLKAPLLESQGIKRVQILISGLIVFLVGVLIGKYSAGVFRTRRSGVRETGS